MFHPRRVRRRGLETSSTASRHVDLVDVGALLAIDFDVDEEFVHHLGGCFVLEALVRHYVAPVARRISDREQDRAVAALGLCERLWSPWPPVDRVMLVLKQVGAGLACKAIFGMKCVHGKGRCHRVTSCANRQCLLRHPRRNALWWRVAGTAAPLFYNCGACNELRFII